jgi:phospholipase/carboxylesterase
MDKKKTKLGFIHRFMPPKNEESEERTRQRILSPRGKVLENDIILRFFRRLAEGVFDIEDLKFRTNELADFVNDASKAYDFDLQYIIAVGYSNGVNIAASMLLLRP